MIDRQKFLEPTKKYTEENSLLSNRTPEIAKDWFNADLIFFAVQYKNADYQQSVLVQMAFDKFQKHYEISQTYAEISELFGEYSKESFDELMIELVRQG
jgi:hypothetical protein